MAKMFYTMEETRAALAKNEEEIKQLAREGRLREFRDGPRLMFKADQVEQLKSELAGGGATEPLGLTPADSDAPISLVGDSTAGGTGVSAAIGGKKEDSAFADIGLSGALGGSAAGMKMPGSGSGLSGLSSGGSGISSGTGAGRGGITIFEVDESQKVDPSAQTAINAGVQEQVNLESVGSGSGLLDLTRESDDTSLGAVFDELTPGKRAPAMPPPAAGSSIALEPPPVAETPPALDRAARVAVAAPIYVEQSDPLATALGAAAVVAAAIVCFGGFLLAATVADYRPEVLESLSWENGMKMYLLLAIGITIVVGAVGFFVGKSGVTK